MPWLQTRFGFLLNRGGRTAVAVPMTIEDRRLSAKGAAGHRPAVPIGKGRTIFGVRISLVTRNAGLPWRVAAVLKTIQAASPGRSPGKQALSQNDRKKTAGRLRRWFLKKFSLVKDKH